MAQTIYTVGHSNLSFMSFLSLIQDNDITHIIDIRSIPYSRYAPWSNKSRLSELLRPVRIRYSYLGHKLGGKKHKIDSELEQEDMSTREIYNEAIQTLLQLSEQGKLVLLCAEGDPENCHRQHFIAQTLLNSGIKVLHILKDGSLKEAWREEASANQPKLL